MIRSYFVRSRHAWCLLFLAVSLSMLRSVSAAADTLLLLEYERALFIDRHRTGESNFATPVAIQARLFDLEQLVIRDDRLLVRHTPVVRYAFDNYDLTFLMLSAREQRMTPMAVWMEQLGISTEKIEKTKLIGY